MARPQGAGRFRRRLAAARRLPWRRVGIGAAVFVVLLVAVPPFRQAVSLATSRAILGTDPAHLTPAATGSTTTTVRKTG